MYNDVVTYEDDDDFAVPKTRLKNVLNCYNTQLSALIWHKRKQYPSSNKLTHELERENLPQNSSDIDRNSCGAIACLMILKKSTPTKRDFISKLKPENCRKEFFFQLNILLSRYWNPFFVTNRFDKNKYFHTLWNIHFSCENNVHDKCDMCNNHIIENMHLREILYRIKAPAVVRVYFRSV